MNYSYESVLPHDAPEDWRYMEQKRARDIIGCELFDMVQRSAHGMAITLETETREDFYPAYAGYGRPTIKTRYYINATAIERHPYIVAYHEPISYPAAIPSPQLRYTGTRAMITELWNRSPFSVRTNDELRKRARVEL